jgi:predicted NBD/HSP70 family sugar kinase
VALVDLNGRFLARETIGLDGGRSKAGQPEQAAEKIAFAMQGICERHADKSVEGIGLSMPGRVDPETQRLILAPNLHWGEFDLKGAIEARMGLQVELANAANACLMAELWSGRMDGVRDAVLVTVSEGIGAAILANGQIVTGRSGLAGEFGHSPIDPAGPMCGCGQRGCWEVFASSNAALRYYAEAAPEAGPIGIDRLISLAAEGDAQAEAALHRQATWLGRGLRLITAALAPELILITGDITAAWERLGPVVRQELESTMLAGAAPRLEPSGDGELSRLRGAAAVVLQRHSGYRR